MDIINEVIDSLRQLSNEEFKIYFELMRSGDLQAREILIKHHLYIIRGLLESRKNKISEEEYSSFFNEGVLALIDALDKYSPGSQSFKRFASFRCFCAITEGIRGKLPDLDRSVPEDKIIPVDSRKIFDKCIKENYERDFVTDLEHREIYASLKNELITLTSIERKILKMRFYDKLSFSKIGEKLDKSKGEIISSMREILNKFRESLAIRYEQKNDDMSLEFLEKCSSYTSIKARKAMRSYNESQIKYVLEGIQMLPRDDGKILSMYIGINYEYPMTLEHIAAELNSNRSHIGVVIKRALKDLGVIVPFLKAIETSDDVSLDVVELVEKYDFQYVNLIRMIPQSRMSMLYKIIDSMAMNDAEAIKMFLNWDGYVFNSRSEITAKTNKNSVADFVSESLITAKRFIVFRNSCINSKEDVSLQILQMVKSPKSSIRYTLRFMPVSGVANLLETIDTLPLEDKVLIRLYLGLDTEHFMQMSELANVAGLNKSNVYHGIDRILKSLERNIINKIGQVDGSKDEKTLKYCQ